MTRIGRLGGNTSRPLAIFLTLALGFTVAFGPLGPEPVVALGASSGPATGSSTAPGSASTAPGPLLGQAAPSDSPLPSPTDSPLPSDSPTPAPSPTDSPLPSDSPSPSPTDSPSPSPSDSPSPSPSDSPSPSPSDSPSPSPSASASPSPSSVPLPPGVVDEMGGSVTLGHVTIDVPPGAVSMQTRFSLGPAHGPDYADIPPVEVFALHTKQLDTGGETDRFGLPVRLTVDTGALDLSGLDESSLRIARLGLDGTWDVLPTRASAAALTAETDQIGTFGVVAKSSAATINLTLSSDAPVTGRHRVDPGAAVIVTVRAVPDGPVATGTLFATVPLDWTLADADGAVVDPTTGELSWPLASLDPGQVVSHRLALQAPRLAADSRSLETTGSFNARIVRRRAPMTRADAISVLVAPRVMIEHRVMAKVDHDTKVATYESQDAQLTQAPMLRVFRVRFRVENPDSVAVTLVPLIQYRDATGAVFTGLPGLIGAIGDPLAGAWVPLPSADEAQGEARFYVAPEARDYHVEVDGIDGDETKTHDEADGGAQAGTGFHAAAGNGPGPFTQGVGSRGMNPAPTLTIPADSWTEVEFSVRATIWSDYDGSYELRLTDNGEAIEPSVVAAVTIEPDPALTQMWVTGGQNLWPPNGPFAAVGAPYPLAPRKVGAAGGAAPGSLTIAGLQAAAGTSPHGDTSLTTDTCASCHRTHTATGPYLATGPLPQSTQCFICHNGTGASSDIASQYAAATPNDPATSSYYQHPATAANSGHANANLDEFLGVLNRHAECADCHNPHSPTETTGAASTMTPSGWTASGALGGASGIGVTNGAAGTAPAYGWLNTPPSSDEGGTTYAVATGPLQYEYQLCLKCHSGYTTLPTPNPSFPSQWALDKGIELNPANDSYHPVEAAGKNTSTYISCSLSGGCPGVVDTNPYRLWTFTATDTVRCTQCHGSKVAATLPPADGSLQIHANPNRGLLIQEYRDRDLHVSTEQSFVPSEFALCFSCHAVAPFATRSTSARADTAFRVHSVHLGFFTGSGADVTSIDQAGAGAGTAICSECHFRTHSTAQKYGISGRTQTGAGAGLVNFAPNVEAFDKDGTLTLEWIRDTSGGQPTGGGNCTLTCHGYTHNAKDY